MNNIPKIKDLYEVENIEKLDALTVLLNMPPKENWVKLHPYIKGYKYIPIERIEFLLKSIFKRYRIEILREGSSFNGVYTVVRVNYFHPIYNEWDFHDGIGAIQLQTAKGTSPADLNNINNGALSMAFPISKTMAVKDACDHFGKLFGSDLNRKVNIEYTLDLSLIKLTPKHKDWNSVVNSLQSGSTNLEEIKSKYSINEENEDLLIEYCGLKLSDISFQNAIEQLRLGNINKETLENDYILTENQKQILQHEK